MVPPLAALGDFNSPLFGSGQPKEYRVSVTGLDGYRAICLLDILWA